MTFAQLQAEVQARGLDYLGQDAAGLTRLKLWANQAYFEICDFAPWPFLETTTTGTAPLTISDVKDILYVTDTTNQRKLDFTDIRDVVDRDYNPLTTGTPDSYYFNGDVLTLYPADTGVSLSVRYVKTPAELSADSDTPLLPSRFHYLIVEGAVLYGMRDSDNYEAAAAVQQTFDQGLLRMQDALFSRNLDDTQYVRRVMAHDG